MIKHIRLILLLYICSLPSFGAGQIEPKMSSDVRRWEVESQGVHLLLTQIKSEQLQAFYVNRGFSIKAIDDYAQSCVYMTVLRNDSAPGVIHFIRDNWSIQINNQRHKMRTVDQWVHALESKNIKKSALIAFRWAQFPPEQSYDPGGNWNQGMLSTGVAVGSVFDVTARWDIAGKPYQSTLKEVRCE